MEIPYGSRTNIENMFLLGDFGVKLCGNTAELIQLPVQLAMCDITTQGFPFYGGNVTYEIPLVSSHAGTATITASMFRSPLLKVQMNDSPEKTIAFSPYQVSLPCKAGENMLLLTVFGNRANTFGPIHNCSSALNMSSPKSWRTLDTSWAYEYQIKPTGLLKSPVVFCHHGRFA